MVLSGPADWVHHVSLSKPLSAQIFDPVSAPVSKKKGKKGKWRLLSPWHVKPQLTVFTPKCRGAPYWRCQSLRCRDRQALSPVKFPPPAPYPHTQPRDPSSDGGDTSHNVEEMSSVGRNLGYQCDVGLMEVWGRGESCLFWNITGLPLHEICLVPIKSPQESASQKVLVLIYSDWHPGAQGLVGHRPW